MEAKLTPQPTMLPVIPAGIPAELTASDQWLVWALEWNGKKWTKVPYKAGTYNKKASSTNPATWASYDTALSALAAYESWNGLGRTITDAEPYTALDLDNCRDPETEEIDQWAQDIVDDLDSYTEVTPSGTGIRIWIKGKPPTRDQTTHVPNAHPDAKIEVFGRDGRFVTMTGQRLTDTTTIKECQPQLDALYKTYWGDAKKGSYAVGSFTGAASPPLDDDEVIALCQRSANGAKFNRLWDGDAGEYDNDASRADMGLIHLLRFRTQDPAQIERIVCRSGLDRPKRHDRRGNGSLIQYDIAKALAESFETWGGPTKAKHRLKKGGNSSVSGAYTDDNDESEQETNLDSEYCEYSVQREWDQIAPLTESAIPAFPTEVLPSWVRRFVMELSESTQTPPDLAAFQVQAAIATAVARKVRVNIRDDWYEPLNIYNAVALDSGERKTAVHTAVVRPIEDYEAKLCDESALTIAKHESQIKIAEKSLQSAETAASKANHNERDDAILLAMAEADTLSRLIRTKPVTPCLLADDISPEKVANVLAEQGGRLSIMSDEGGIFDIMAGRYSDKANIDVFLKGHTAGTVRVKRLGRGDDLIPGAALTMGLAIQPSVIAGLSANPSFRGKGLLARYAYAIPKGRVGYRSIRPKPMSAETRQAYHDTLTKLLAIPLPPSPHTLIFGEKADREMERFEQEIELTLREFGNLGEIKDWGSKLPGLVGRVAGHFHLAERIADDSDDLAPWETPVSSECVKRAVRLAKEYLIPHALAAFALMGANESVNDAKYVLRWIEGRADITEPFTKRDLHQATRGRFKTVDKLDDPLDVLIAHGYVRKMDGNSERKGPGRKPSQTYEVNPDLATHNTHNTQNQLLPGSDGGFQPDAECPCRDRCMERGRCVIDDPEFCPGATGVTMAA